MNVVYQEDRSTQWTYHSSLRSGFYTNIFFLGKCRHTTNLLWETNLYRDLIAAFLIYRHKISFNFLIKNEKLQISVLFDNKIYEEKFMKAVYHRYSGHKYHRDTFYTELQILFKFFSYQFFCDIMSISQNGGQNLIHQIFAPAYVCHYYNIIYICQIMYQSSANNIMEFLNGKRDWISNNDLKMIVKKLQEDFGGDYDILHNWLKGSLQDYKSDFRRELYFFLKKSNKSGPPESAYRPNLLNLSPGLIYADKNKDQKILVKYVMLRKFNNLKDTATYYREVFKKWKSEKSRVHASAMNKKNNFNKNRTFEIKCKQSDPCIKSPYVNGDDSFCRCSSDSGIMSSTMIESDDVESKNSILRRRDLLSPKKRKFVDQMMEAFEISEEKSSSHKMKKKLNINTKPVTRELQNSQGSTGGYLMKLLGADKVLGSYYKLFE